MSDSDTLSNCFAEYCSACPPDFDFPTGSSVKIPTPSECALAKAFEAALPTLRDQIYPIRKTLTVRNAHHLTIFAVRTALLAARSNSKNLIDVSILALLIDEGLVDWRDTLIALSLIEDCSKRVGVDFRRSIESHVALATDTLRKTIVNGYLARSEEMRSIKIMGFTSRDSDEGLVYIKN